LDAAAAPATTTRPQVNFLIDMPDRKADSPHALERVRAVVFRRGRNSSKGSINMPDLTQRIGQHFTLADIVTSPTASRRGIDNVTPLTAQFLRNAIALTEEILDPERNHWNSPSLISSWFRSPALNRAIPGSSRTSQHLTAQAADHRIHGVSIADQFNWLAFESDLPFDQVIFEFNRWVHVSFTTDSRPRGERLRISDRGTTRVLRPIRL
jgi:zinc D-Ala-D-Ala carboxypeptidase